MAHGSTNDSMQALVPIVIGANHCSSALSLRDQLFVDDDNVPKVLALLSEAGLKQALVLSTCDRVEVHAFHADTDKAASAIQNALAISAGINPDEIRDQLYLHQGNEALRHIMRVCASLDSQVVGEPQVFGQVKAAHRMASDAKMMGPELEAFMQASYGAAKQVMNDTSIGERAVSIASAAVQVARDVHGDIAKCRALLIGDGEMGELVARNLLDQNISHLSVLHHRPAQCAAMAKRLDCHSLDWDGLAGEMAQCEILITAQGRHNHIVTADMVHAAIRARRRRLMYIVDLALPGDVDPSVNRIDEAFLYDLGDLERVALDGLTQREGEVDKADLIVVGRLAAFLRDKTERQAVPIITQLRDHVENMRDDILREADGDTEKALNLLINKVLHDPSVALRTIAANGPNAELRAMELAIERLFALDKHSKQHNESGE